MTHSLSARASQAQIPTTVSRSILLSFLRRYNGLSQGAIQCPAAPETCAAPLQWYPQLSQPLGAPLGPAVRSGNAWRRQFEHASVLLDLDMPNNSGVVFSGDAATPTIVVEKRIEQ